MVMMTVKPGLLLVVLCELEEEETEARSFFGERGQTGAASLAWGGNFPFLLRLRCCSLCANRVPAPPRLGAAAAFSVSAGRRF